LAKQQRKEVHREQQSGFRSPGKRFPAKHDSRVVVLCVAHPSQSAEEHSPKFVDSDDLPLCRSHSPALLSHTLPLVLFCSAIATRPRRLVWTNKCSRVPRAIATERGEVRRKTLRHDKRSGRRSNGNGVAGTSVQIRCEQESAIQEVQSGQDGRFAFDRVTAGPFQLTATGEGFVPQTISNTVRPGDDYVVPPITMYLATVVTEVRVSPSTEEIAQEEFKDLEHQRVLGIVPNYYVSYIGEAAPLTPKRKFELALKATTDPVTVAAVAAVAGVDQATNRFSGYGQGGQAYAKRFGASYTNFASGLWIGGAVLPSILKQDPRYFYKGTGTKRSRFLYAVSRPFICKGDNQRWQPNYSSVFGDLAAGALSNLYIPERDRHGAALTFENAGIALGTSAVINVLQEFVLHRITSKRE